jgi:hypothetical protein
MLEDVPGLINPIIQAMIQTSRQQGETADRAQRAQQMQEELKYRKAQLAQEEHKTDVLTKEHEDNMDLNRKYYEIYSQHAQAELEKQGLDRLAQTLSINKQKADLRQNQGVDLNQILPMGSGRSQGGPVDQNAGIPDESQHQQSVLDYLQQQSKVTAQGTGEGQAQAALSDPGTMLFNRLQAAQKEEDERKNAFQTQIEGLKETREDNRERIRQAGAMSRIGQEGANQIALQKFKLNYGMDDTTGSRASKAKQNVDAIFNGNTDPSKLPKQDLEDAINFASQNHENLPLGQAWKDYKSVLDSTGKLQALTDQATDFANKYSADSPNAGSVGNHYMNMGSIIGTHGYVAPGSETETSHNGLMQSAGQYVKQLEGMSRTSDPNLVRQISAVGNPGTTMKQNKDNIQQVLTLGNQNLRDQTPGIPPDRLHQALASRGIKDFGAVNTQQAFKFPLHTNPQTGQVIGTNDGKNWVDVKTGQPYTGAPQ